MFSVFVFAQKDTVEVPDVFAAGEGTLNTAIQTAIDAGTLSNTVFKLAPYGLYVLTGAVTTPSGQVLEIVAPEPGNTQETAPPLILWTASSAPDKRYNFNCSGDVIMKNIWLIYGSIDGAQVGSTLRVGDSVGVSATGMNALFEGCLFEYSGCPQNGSGAVEVYSGNFKGAFKNCYFRNNMDPHYRYYGRALSFRYESTGLHIDSVLFENCTFANQGYVYMQEGAEYGDKVHFNHCTFYNIVMFTLEQGWWNQLSVTNSLFVNTFMYGAIPVNDGEGFGGTIAITAIDSFGFSVPFGEQDRRILFANNAYYMDNWLVEWMGYGTNGNPYSQDLRRQRRDDEIPVPHPMINSDTRKFFDSVDAQGNRVFPYMNIANIPDSVDPGFVSPPLNLDSLKSFLYHKWYDAADVNWAWQKDSSFNQVWPLQEDLSYSSDLYKTAALGDYPLGDLYHWWPEQYAAWKAQATNENARVQTWLQTGIDPGTVGVVEVPGVMPKEYTLAQNFPNPFNPVTKIQYSVPNSGHVSIKVYNALGSEVATIFEGEQASGSYIASFDASQLASGVYFYRLQAGSVQLTKKLVLMK
jgi:hypothetical protein